MFENISDKIKGVALISTIVGMICSVISGIIMMASQMFLMGLLVIFLGCLLSWVGSFALYALGELVEKTNEIAQNTKRLAELNVAEVLEKMDKEDSDFNAKEVRKAVVEDYMADKDREIYEEKLGTRIEDMDKAKEGECPFCFHKIEKSDDECPYCGMKLRK